ncbi:DsbA family protein [Altericroceibacterium xinjiangense]|uniref:DsbA family protein n=1 Tax=Altericroceibacterium xinjiangense TaxID=762261 RepID=UPI001F49E5FE|nr:DsbA family protein [Altericroceibacterium xinjiangense]
MMRWILTIVLALVGGFAGAALWDQTPWAGNSTRAYLLANPEVLPEAIALLQQRQQSSQIAPVRAELQRPFPGAVLGNPNGDVTLVEFTDYACGYCRQSVEDVKALIAANPDLKVVVREYPILAPESADAARMALAAAQQGRYAAFHDAMFRLGPPSAETIAQAAREAGVDVPRAQEAIASGVFDRQLQENVQLATRLGFQGTPTWVIGDRAIAGAVGQATLAEAIEQERSS